MNSHAQYFIHLEHIDLVAPKNVSQPSVTHNLTFVRWILELIAFDVVP